MTTRETIIAYSIKNSGDWNKTYIDIVKNGLLTQEDCEKVFALKCETLVITDADYPEALRNIRKPPLVLYYYGDISLLNNYKNNVSIVGSRKYSEYGASKTIEIASGLARKGYTIVSGLAKGIDAIAHRACIDNGGRTIAVLGCGIDICYPIENQDLYEIIKRDHLVISEYPFDVEPLTYHFPIRNRIIALASKTLVLTEGNLMSGSSITAHLALAGNTDVMCVPYHAGEGSVCNRLINCGAVLVENAEDVVDAMSSF